MTRKYFAFCAKSYSGGYYIYRGCNGLGGRGEFSEVDGRPMIEFNGRRHPY